MSKGMIKLSIIQQKLNAPKDKKNTFGGYNYRSCESILEAVKPLLVEVGATLVIKVTIELIGSRFYIKATASLHDVDTGEVIAETTSYAREEDEKKGMDAAQVTGSTSSYARKYALNGLFAIDDNKDADTNEYKKTQDEAKKAEEEAKKKAAAQQPKTAPKPAAKPAPAQPVQLTEEQQELKDQLLADIDAAQDYASLKASVALASGQPFESEIRNHANQIGVARGFIKVNK